MDGGIAQLAGALDDTAAPGIDPDIFGLGIVGVHTAQVRQPQAAVALHFCHHTAQGVRMGLQEQGVLVIFAAQVDEHTALGGDVCLKAQLGESISDPFGSSGSKARGGVDGQELHGLLPGVIRVDFFNHWYCPPKMR